MHDVTLATLVADISMKAGMVSDTLLVQGFIQVVLGEAQHLEWACGCAWSGNMQRWLFCGSGCGNT